MNQVAYRAKPNPAALVGALGVPAAIAGLLVAGLAVTVVAPGFVPNPDAEFVEEEVVEFTPAPLPDKPVDPSAPATAPDTPMPTRPDRPSDIPFDFGESDPIGSLPGLGDPIGDLGDIGPIVPPPRPSFVDPVVARPKGNPGNWVTDADYRSRWIREEMSGTASFILAIDASGRVTGCTITRSSGHAELDAATCKLIQSRGRFEPARNAEGKRVAGTYSNAITWKIPD